jgi:glycosyltransferase involved in cell wall biosynthesis
VKPRVLFVSYTSEWTGPSNSLLLLARSLGDQFESTVLLPAGGDFERLLARHAIPTVTLPAITKHHLLSFVDLIRDGRFDLVYANTPDRTSRIALAAARVTGARYICHVRAMGWESSWIRLGHLRLADAVIAVSRAAAESVARFVAPSRLHVVYNGIDAGDPSKAVSSDKMRELTGWPTGSLALVGLANLCERKGQTHAVAAMDLLRRRVPEARLALVGRLDREPEYASALQEEIRTRALVERVSLLGFREDGAALLRHADVMVHTALADPHPRAVLEAMVAGVPVVAFAVDGVAETVVHGETGLLVPPGDAPALADALEQLAREPDLRTRLGGAGRRRVVDYFSNESTVNGVRRVIEQVLAVADRGCQDRSPTKS